MTTDPVGWAAALRPGTIVSFRFPLGEGEGPSKTRPCLVIGNTVDDGVPRVTLAYGTSADSDSNRGLDLELSEPAGWKAAGLHRPTRFVLMRRVTVGLDDPGFNLHRAGGPVIGILPEPMLTALHQLSRLLGVRIVENRARGRLESRGRKRRTEQPSRGQPRRPEPVIVRRKRKRYERPETTRSLPGVSAA